MHNNEENVRLYTLTIEFEARLQTTEEGELEDRIIYEDSLLAASLLKEFFQQQASAGHYHEVLGSCIGKLTVMPAEEYGRKLAVHEAKAAASGGEDLL